MRHLVIAVSLFAVRALAQGAIIEIGTPDGGAVKTQLVTIQSEPSGATVAVNHQVVGKSPVVAKLVSNAASIVTVELAGYQAHEQTVSPTAQKPLAPTLRVKLLPEVPKLEPVAATSAGVPVVIESFPTGAAVFVDLQDAGVTPLNVTLSPGGHDVTFMAAGYLNATEHVDARASEVPALVMTRNGGVAPAPSPLRVFRRLTPFQ